MYKVIKAFHDLQDSKDTKNGKIYHEYNVGDIFPRKGMDVSEERIQELTGNDNKQGVPLIELVEEEETAKKTAEKSSSSKTSSKKTTKAAAE